MNDDFKGGCGSGNRQSASRMLTCLRQVKMGGVVRAFRLKIEAITPSLRVSDRYGAPPAHWKHRSEEKENLRRLKAQEIYAFPITVNLPALFASRQKPEGIDTADSERNSGCNRVGGCDAADARDE